MTLSLMDKDGSPGLKDLYNVVSAEHLPLLQGAHRQRVAP